MAKRTQRKKTEKNPSRKRKKTENPEKTIVSNNIRHAGTKNLPEQEVRSSVEHASCYTPDCPMLVQVTIPLEELVDF